MPTGVVREGEMWLYNLHIAPYSHSGPAMSHDPERVRKLLLRKNQITRIANLVAQEPVNLIPLSVYFKAGKAKLELATAKSLKTVDKRHKIAKRDQMRDIERELARRRR